jgi:hypothetical protein
MERKIIQIQTCVQNGVYIITCLCEDGSVWNSYDSNSWELVEPSFKKKDKGCEDTPPNKTQLQQSEISECINILNSIFEGNRRWKKKVEQVIQKLSYNTI